MHCFHLSFFNYIPTGTICPFPLPFPAMPCMVCVCTRKGSSTWPLVSTKRQLLPSLKPSRLQSPCMGLDTSRFVGCDLRLCVHARTRTHTHTHTHTHTCTHTHTHTLAHTHTHIHLHTHTCTHTHVHLACYMHPCTWHLHTHTHTHTYTQLHISQQHKQKMHSLWSD